jgi:hypothetical protein
MNPVRRSPLSTRISELSEWIRNHYLRADDGFVRDDSSKQAWIRRARQYVLELDPHASQDSAGLLATTYRDLTSDLEAVSQTPAPSPDAIERHFKSAIASFAAIDEACIFVPESLERVIGSANPYFVNLPPGLGAPAAFVLMPFSLPWSEQVWDAVRQIVRSAPLTPQLDCVRADDLFGHDVLHDIVAAIQSCEVVIADITGRNPNVFYELGIAHAFGKRVVLLTQSVDDIPFDIQRFRHVIYATTEEGMSRLAYGMTGALRDLFVEGGI